MSDEELFWLLARSRISRWLITGWAARVTTAQHLSPRRITYAVHDGDVYMMNEGEPVSWLPLDHLIPELPCHR